MRVLFFVHTEVIFRRAYLFQHYLNIELVGRQEMCRHGVLDK
jgi:hypothetical protein